MRVLLAGLVAVLAACSPPPSAPGFPIAGHAVAGPTCPVEPAEPEPGQCDPRPVAGARLIVTDAGGKQVATLTTAADGGFTATLPAGDFTITPQPVDGLLGGASPIEVTVTATEAPADLVIAYDTGIR